MGAMALRAVDPVGTVCIVGGDRKGSLNCPSGPHGTAGKTGKVIAACRNDAN
jgi:hypothetical protein